jgi:hypothetical protein
MKLSDYFEGALGSGVLATADSEGRVDVALYARPHFADEETVAFIMADRLTHSNLQSNPHAAYLFMESAEGYRGKRLFLTRTREEQDAGLIDSLRRRDCAVCREDADKARYVVYFHVDRVLPLVGAGS